MSTITTRKQPYAVLTKEQAMKLTWPRLKNLMSSVRAHISGIRTYAGRRCCEVCHEFIGTDEEWEREVAVPCKEPQAYFDMLKECSTLLPHFPKKERTVTRSGR